MKTLLPLALIMTLTSLSSGEPAAGKKKAEATPAKETKAAKVEASTPKPAEGNATATTRDPAAEQRAQAAIARAKQGAR